MCFEGSPHFVHNSAARSILHNVALWGPGYSADVAGGVERVADITTALEANSLDRIYNVDEIGLFNRCMPSRAKVVAGQRRRTRGTKAVPAKDRVIVVLSGNATGARNGPAAMIDQ